MKAKKRNPKVDKTKSGNSHQLSCLCRPNIPNRINIAALQVRNSTPYFFDEMTPRIIDSIEGLLAQPEFKLGAISRIEDGSLVSETDVHARFRTRKAGEFFVQEMSFSKDRGSYKEGEVLAMCYYFKDVTPEASQNKN